MSDSLWPPNTTARQASLSFTISQSLHKLMSMEVIHRWYHPTVSSSVTPFSSCPRSFPESGSFPMSRSSYQVVKVLELQHSPSNEHSGFISFVIDWFDLLAVQETLKSLLQHHSSKASILQAQPSLWSSSHPYMMTGKTIALTRWTFVGKVMSLIYLEKVNVHITLQWR